MQDKYFLREDVYFEPLFNHWYAWPYLLPPVPGARHLVNTHRRIMKSFVNNYKLHLLACQDPGMAGGDYLDCSEEQVGDIQALLDEMEARCADLIELSDAVKTLDELVRGHVSGESIEGLYAQLPAPLQGFVELFFDLEHHAGYRLIEPLLYRSKYYRRDLQSVSFGLMSKSGQRPFVLSTPRLPDANHLQLPLDFNAPALKRILRSRDLPLDARELAEIESQCEGKGGLALRELFTTTPPERRWEPVRHGIRLNYTGHAGFLVETKDLAVLIDPVIASRDAEHAEQMLSFSDLPPRIDYVCITHSHQDHANLETLLQLRHKIGKVLVPKNNGGQLADPSLRQLLLQFDFDVIEVDELDRIVDREVAITALPFLGEHGDLNIRSKSAWFVEFGGKKLFFGADSSNLDPNLYRHLHGLLGDVDLMAIGMECVGAPYTWLYGALHTKRVSKEIKESRRLNGSGADQALHMAKLFNARAVCVYALGMEPWYKYFMGLEYDDKSEQMVQSRRMVAECHAQGRPCEALYGTRTFHFD